MNGTCTAATWSSTIEIIATQTQMLLSDSVALALPVFPFTGRASATLHGVATLPRYPLQYLTNYQHRQREQQDNSPVLPSHRGRVQPLLHERYVHRRDLE